MFLTIGHGLILFSEASAFSGKPRKDAQKNTPSQSSALKKPSKNKKLSPDPFYKSSKLNKIYLRQAKRQRVIIDYKKKGWVGESDDGSLKIRDIKKVSSKDRALLQKAVKVENSDRKIILKEIEKTAKYSESEKKQMRQRLFKGYLEMDPKGTYYFQADHWQVK